MGLIEYTLDGKVNKVQRAIERIKMFDPISTGLMDEPYYVAYSGGKDSDVIRILFELASVKYDLVHNHTTVDAPETVYYVRSIPNIQISPPETSMWRLIAEKLTPPLRTSRYCCSELKERGGRGRMIVTGVRWAESIRRKNHRGSLEIQGSKKKYNLILNADNEENRRMFETCMRQGKKILNPIIDWQDDEVWEFLNHYGCRSNPLYECGYKRVGCIGCPMSGPRERIKEFNQYPKYRGNYIRAFEKMLQRRIETNHETFSWKTGEDVFNWWIADDKKRPKIMENQMSLFNFLESEG